MVEIISMSIVGGLLVVGAVMMGVESRHAAQLAAAYLERFDHVAHGHYDGLAASRAKAALIFGLVGVLVLGTVIGRVI